MQRLYFSHSSYVHTNDSGLAWLLAAVVVQDPHLDRERFLTHHCLDRLQFKQKDIGHAS